MKRRLSTCAMFAAFGLMAVSGCATTINGTAPTGNGSTYAVGSRSNQAQAWICPATPSKAECEPIVVQETER